MHALVVVVVQIRVSRLPLPQPCSPPWHIRDPCSYAVPSLPLAAPGVHSATLQTTGGAVAPAAGAGPATVALAAVTAAGAAQGARL